MPVIPFVLRLKPYRDKFKRSLDCGYGSLWSDVDATAVAAGPSVLIFSLSMETFLEAFEMAGHDTAARLDLGNGGGRANAGFDAVFADAAVG